MQLCHWEEVTLSARYFRKKQGREAAPVLTDVLERPAAWSGSCMRDRAKRPQEAAQQAKSTWSPTLKPPSHHT